MPLRIGVDLGGTKIEGVVLDDASGQVLARERVATESARGYDHIVAAVAGLVARLEASHPGCASVGIGTPGAISSRTGLMKNSNTTCLNGRDLPGDLARTMGRPLLVENDANCFALAEARHGAGRDGRRRRGLRRRLRPAGRLAIDDVVAFSNGDAARGRDDMIDGDEAQRAG